MSGKIPFLGTGWGFPPEFDRARGTVNMLSDVEDIESSLAILFSTEPGERVMQPTYGSDLKKLLFEPLDTTLKTYIKELIETAVLYHEPRIRLDAVNLEARPEEGALLIKLEYTVRTTNSRYNYVYPYYLTEATNLKR